MGGGCRRRYRRPAGPGLSCYASPIMKPSTLPGLSDRTTGLLGLVSVAVILAGAVVAAIPYTGWSGESYSPLNHFVSELGELAISRLAVLMDAGVVIGGVGLGFFLVLVARRMTGRLAPALAVAGIVAGLFGALVGLFPMDRLAVHRIVSGGFFLTCWLTAGTFAVWLARNPRAGFPRWLLAPAVFSVAVDFVFVAVYSTYHPANPDAHILSRPDIWIYPLLEWASLLSLFLWLACTAAVLAGRHSSASEAPG
jgi:hypothetical membrane protein